MIVDQRHLIAENGQLANEAFRLRRRNEKLHQQVTDLEERVALKDACIASLTETLQTLGDYVRATS